jgi:hypothetical protein
MIVEIEGGLRSPASLHRMKAAVRAFFYWTADWKKPSNGFNRPPFNENHKRILTGPLTCCIFVLTMY